ncbi:hypothetical protein [Methylobacterium nodulans]|uniref:VWFA domain-containing protein n=1 Tax=Methylobacterium nodulans (strain LMG 21967 / CNCM I-2342 / ORS 2060) TaxID=460265 RepID=B8IFL2_METNO|nr:hypothetical protein [Methylobacterium nodulans]ACL57747.1 conserved hypothetical protein [Methylobacterium nodulans ORS 2060]
MTADSPARIQHAPPIPDKNYNKSVYTSIGYIVNTDGSNPSSRFPPTNQDLTTPINIRNALDALTTQAYTNAKAAGISVYTIGFSTPSDSIDDKGLSLLSNCASSSSQAFVANDANTLISAFNQIAKSVGSLRLTR